MKITKTSVSFGFTKNIGDYQSLRYDTMIEAEVGEDASVVSVQKALFEMVKEEIRIQSGERKEEKETEPPKDLGMTQKEVVSLEKEVYNQKMQSINNK